MHVKIKTVYHSHLVSITRGVVAQHVIGGEVPEFSRVGREITGVGQARFDDKLTTLDLRFRHAALKTYWAQAEMTY